MYKIMIVEDEPPITRYLMKLVAAHCPGFKVDYTADNGAEALQKIALAKPDVILTDVKMPVMDGIELVSKVKTDYPEIYTVIVSGYQDFEYAREAIKLGVMDYLLKPVEPGQLKDLLNTLALKLDKDYFSGGVELLARLASGLSTDEAKMVKYLKYQHFAAIVIRKGALPTGLRNKPSDMKEFSGLTDLKAFDLPDVEMVWQIGGRDEAEIVLILGMDHGCKIKNVSEAFQTILDNYGGFHTIIHSSRYFELKDLAEKVAGLYEALNQSIIIGKSQTLDDTVLGHVSTQAPPILNSPLVNKIEFLITSRSLSQLKDELGNLFKTWENESRTQAWMEKMLRQILGVVEKHTVEISADTSLNLEKQLEEALFYATDFDGLFNYIWDMIVEMISPDSASKKSSSANLLQRVDTYLHQNLAEPITLQGICEQIGVSQPYLSRLFRKSKDMSFIEYCNHIRINEAKRLMVEHPEMLLKDVALIVGYKDPYYFSRIFKAVTGTAPSEYRIE
jgi:two-component system response regulator YesN